MLARFAVLAAAVLALAPWSPGQVRAQSNTATQAAQAASESFPAAIPDADETMRRMSNLLTSAQTFTLHIEKTFDVVQDDGAKVQFAGAADIAVRRPDGIYMDYGDDVSAKEFWYDGSTFTLVDHLHGVYGSAAAAPTIDSALDQLAADYGVFLPLAGLVSADPYARYAAGIESKRYVGLHDVGGIPSHHFLFRGKHSDWQIWIEDGERPLPRKIVVTLRELEGAPQHSAVLSDWDLESELDDDLFVAEVPDGAIKAEFLKTEEQEP